MCYKVRQDAKRRGLAVDAAGTDDISDIFVIGGGVNGCGIARDAAGRGLKVVLAEMGDLASGTSSASTKLFHGGLRYLEYFEIRLVREALVEREMLLEAMPHIAWPMRFILPFHKDMRFEGGTPMSRLLGVVMPWARGRRPAWLIRAGLFLYDTLGGRRFLPGTRSLRLAGTREGAPLLPTFRHAYEYSDGWVDDARLVVLNARDAACRGADIRTRSRVVSAAVEDGLWSVRVQDQRTGQIETHRARALVNAGGPWVGEVLQGALGQAGGDPVRLVRGSHIVVPRLQAHDKAYFLQGKDGRIVFMIPYEDDFTLIGTTDQDHAQAAEKPVCAPGERDYLIDFVNGYLRTPLRASDVVWTYSGLRALHDDKTSHSATAATRDYFLDLDETPGAPLLNVFGGKITTYRRLAERAVDKLGHRIGVEGAAWTRGAALPGGDFAVGGAGDLAVGLAASYPFLDLPWARRLARTYGTEARNWLGTARVRSDLGTDFGATLTEAELVWLREQEFAETAEDVLWRRTKLGLRLTGAQVQTVADWMAERQEAS
jgi:glycerol-3-phosphate dehydrogenase